MADDMTDVDKIISKANDVAYYAADDGRSQVRMTITNAKGDERRRQFTILRKDREGGDQDYVVLFDRPADVRGTTFLVKKHVGGDDDRWLYLPDLDLVRRIAAGDKRTSFVGSNFFYEDVSGRRLDVDTHELLETTDEHYVVKNTPVAGEKVEFSHWIAWIDKTTFVPVKMDYMDGDEVYRRIEALEVQGRGRPPDGDPDEGERPACRRIHDLAVFATSSTTSVFRTTSLRSVRYAILHASGSRGNSHALGSTRDNFRRGRLTARGGAGRLGRRLGRRRGAAR